MNYKAEYSVIFPVHNEEEIINNEIPLFIKEISKHLNNCEIILVENGSTDNTYSKLLELKKKYSMINILKLDYADPGDSIRQGVLHSNGEIIITQEVDNWDVPFIMQGIKSLGEFDLIQASKMSNKWENASLTRKILSKSLNYFLVKFFKFKGSETHGNEIYKKSKMLHIVKRCDLGWGAYRTELRLRSQYENMRIKEIPYKCVEIRPTRKKLIIKLIRNIFLLFKLYVKFTKERIITST